MFEQVYGKTVESVVKRQNIESWVGYEELIITFTDGTVLYIESGAREDSVLEVKIN